MTNQIHLQDLMTEAIELAKAGLFVEIQPSEHQFFMKGWDAPHGENRKAILEGKYWSYDEAEHALGLLKTTGRELKVKSGIEIVNRIIGLAFAPQVEGRDISFHGTNEHVSVHLSEYGEQVYHRVAWVQHPSFLQDLKAMENAILSPVLPKAEV